MSTEVQIEITVRAFAECPGCHERLEKRLLISEVEVIHANIDLVAEARVRARGEVEEAKVRRSLERREVREVSAKARRERGRSA